MLAGLQRVLRQHRPVLFFEHALLDRHVRNQIYATLSDEPLRYACICGESDTLCVAN